MSGVEKSRNIEISGARENNLKNIYVSIPTDKLVCVTGVSGCGKSSLVYDTIYAESRRVLFESMAINLFGQKLLEKPDVDSIENLRPTICLAQNFYNRNPRSTVGTISEISRYLRNLFSLSTQGKYKPNDFSPNNPSWFCPYCQGTGEEYGVAMSKLIPNDEKTLAQGAVLLYSGADSSCEMQLLKAFCAKKNINMNTPLNQLPIEQREAILYSEQDGPYDIIYKTTKGRRKLKSECFYGAVARIELDLLNVSAKSVFLHIQKYLKLQPCRICNGKKLSKKILDITISGMNIIDLEQLSVVEIKSWCDGYLKKQEASKNVEFQFLISTMQKCLDVLIQLDLSYLSLSRSAPSLSSGEIQRLRVASYLSNSLIGLLYIFDEPCKGLHPINIKKIIVAAKNLVLNGNSVIAIEHNKQFLLESEYIIELGPHAGPRGGEIIWEGPFNKNKKPGVSFKDIVLNDETSLVFHDINFRTIKNQTLKIPVNQLTCITGVSGSGKSSLAYVIMQSLTKKDLSLCRGIDNAKKISGIDFINQSPIGKTSRSTVVSYLGIYDLIRDYFAASDDAKSAHLTPSHFSMNLAGGRCETCQGTGRIKVNLDYLPETYITCETCGGQRFSERILNIRCNGMNINDVLSKEIDMLLSSFTEIPAVFVMLSCLCEMGLGYLKLGQMSMDISGGEAQRIKLAKILGKKNKRHQLYILDEPTSGLARSDIDKVEKVFNAILASGNTLAIIEHNIEFIVKNANYIVDFGCKAGKDGGEIVFQGLPKNAFVTPKSSWYGLEYLF